MKLFTNKIEKNGKSCQKVRVSKKIYPERKLRKETPLGMRRVSCGLLQYDGLYTLSRIRKKSS